MDDFELPADLSRLSDQELSDLHQAAIAAFQSRDKDDITDRELTEMRQLTTAVKKIREEQETRQKAAEQAAAEIEAMSAELGLADTTTTTDGDDGDGQATGDTADTGAGATSGGGDGGDTATDGQVVHGEVVDVHPDAAAHSAAAITVADRPLPRRLNLSGVRRRQPRVLPQSGPALPEISASVDVPGYAPGQELDLPGVTEGILRRATALRTAGGGVGLVSSYRLPFPQELIVTDPSAGTEGSRAVMHAADQSRLSGGNIVASGGWCAPSETVYTLTKVSCPEMLWDAPEIQLARGGIRFFPVPSLDVSTMTWIHTEADDIAGNEKPCFRIPCPEPTEVRCDPVGVCLESGILTQRHFPELIDHYRNLAMVAHELRIRQALLEQAVARATEVAVAPTFGAVSAIYAAVALQVADMTEKHNLCNTINIEMVLPWWSQKLMLADLARQNGRGLSEVRVQELIDLFATLGVRIQWARGIGPAVPELIGGADPAVDWPSELKILMYVAGSLQIGRGGEISLGVIYDSNRFVTNDYTALFAEECVALVNRGPELRYLTVPICPDGRTAEQAGITCPAGSPGSPAESGGSI